MFPLGLLLFYLVNVYADSDVACRIVANPAEYADRNVTIHGRLRWDREGFYIVAEGCPKVLVTGKYQWKPEICLGASDTAPALVSKIRPIVDVVLSELIQEQIDISIRAEGILRARQEYKALPASNQRYALNGFCAFNESSSLLLTTRLLELRITPR